MLSIECCSASCGIWTLCRYGCCDVVWARLCNILGLYWKIIRVHFWTNGSGNASCGCILHCMPQMCEPCTLSFNNWPLLNQAVFIPQNSPSGLSHTCSDSMVGVCDTMAKGRVEWPLTDVMSCSVYGTCSILFIFDCLYLSGFGCFCSSLCLANTYMNMFILEIHEISLSRDHLFGRVKDMHSIADVPSDRGTYANVLLNGILYVQWMWHSMGLAYVDNVCPQWCLNFLKGFNEVLVRLYEYSESSLILSNH